MRIVVVDDSVTNLIVLKRLSASVHKADVIGFQSANEALEFLEANEVSAVVVDFDMPDCNGVDFISTVRQSVLNRKTPIMMVTGHDNQTVHQAAVKAGATGFLTKPVNPVAFKLELGRLAITAPA